jgi:hypothetical protein
MLSRAGIWNLIGWEWGTVVMQKCGILRNRVVMLKSMQEWEWK